jgi:putative ABC transport system substrate-binding protein
MDRRAFLGGVLAVLVGPIPAAAEPGRKTARLGFLGNQSPTLMAPSVDALRQGLRELGWVEGQNMAIEYRWAHGDLDRHRAFAAELVKLQVDVIIAAGTIAIRASRGASWRRDTGCPRFTS